MIFAALQRAGYHFVKRSDFASSWAFVGHIAVYEWTFEVAWLDQMNASVYFKYFQCNTTAKFPCRLVVSPNFAQRLESDFELALKEAHTLFTNYLCKGTE